MQTLKEQDRLWNTVTNGCPNRVWLSDMGKAVFHCYRTLAKKRIRCENSTATVYYCRKEK